MSFPEDCSTAIKPGFAYGTRKNHLIFGVSMLHLLMNVSVWPLLSILSLTSYLYFSPFCMAKTKPWFNICCLGKPSLVSFVVVPFSPLEPPLPSPAQDWAHVGQAGLHLSVQLRRNLLLPPLKCKEYWYMPLHPIYKNHKQNQGLQLLKNDI